MIEKILKAILKMGNEEQTAIKIDDNRFLFIECFKIEEDYFTSIELNKGYEEDDCFASEEILECAVCDYKNKEEIRSVVEYLLNCI